MIGPAPQFDVRRDELGVNLNRERQHHEQTGMSAEPLRDERLRRFSRLMRQQLRFDAMDARRLLKRFPLSPERTNKSPITPLLLS